MREKQHQFYLHAPECYSPLPTARCSILRAYEKTKAKNLDRFQTVKSKECWYSAIRPVSKAVKIADENAKPE